MGVPHVADVPEQDWGPGASMLAFASCRSARGRLREERIKANPRGQPTCRPGGVKPSGAGSNHQRQAGHWKTGSAPARPMSAPQSTQTSGRTIAPACPSGTDQPHCNGRRGLGTADTIRHARAKCGMHAGHVSLVQLVDLVLLRDIVDVQVDWHAGLLPQHTTSEGLCELSPTARIPDHGDSTTSLAKALAKHLPCNAAKLAAPLLKSIHDIKARLNLPSLPLCRSDYL